MKTLLGLLGAVALLVWGTHIVRTGLLRVYGANLRRVLARSVRNRVAALFAGLGVTSLLQSSTATALIASSFVGQGLIATAPALAMVLGADVGTALMVQVYSLADTHLKRLAWNTPESIETSSLHLDLISEMKRINSHLCSVAYPILESAGVLSPSRLKSEPPPLPQERGPTLDPLVPQSASEHAPTTLPTPQP